MNSLLANLRILQTTTITATAAKSMSILPAQSVTLQMIRKIITTTTIPTPLTTSTIQNYDWVTTTISVQSTTTTWAAVSGNQPLFWNELTSLKTPTMTLGAPGESYYAACDVTNLLGGDGDYGISSYQQADGILSVETIGESGGTMAPYDCCAQCVQTSGCAAAAFLGGSCDMLMVDPSTCLPTYIAANYTLDDATVPGQGYTLSNGACGVFGLAYDTDTD